MSSTEKQYEIENRKNGSILIVLSGKGIGKTQNLTINLENGKIIFLPATSKSLLIDFKECNDDFIAYQAMCNDFKF